jgi:hypothetical protein
MIDPKTIPELLRAARQDLQDASNLLDLLSDDEGNMRPVDGPISDLFTALFAVTCQCQNHVSRAAMRWAIETADETLLTSSPPAKGDE